MATTTLVIVILTLIGNLTIVSLRINKVQKALFCGMIGVVLGGCAIIHNAQTPQVPLTVLNAIRNAPSNEAKQFLVERFNVSSATPDIKAESELKTPLEIFGGLFSVLMLTLAWVLVVAVRESNDEQAGQVYTIVQMLSAAAVMYLLSLYCGLQLSVIAWIKREKAVPVKKHAFSALETGL